MSQLATDSKHLLVFSSLTEEDSCFLNIVGTLENLSLTHVDSCLTKTATMMFLFCLGDLPIMAFGAADDNVGFLGDAEGLN